MKIETKRLLIRNFQADDWNTLREMIVQKESSEYAKYDREWPTSEKEIKKITEWFASGDMFHAVCLKETSKLIGFIALDSVDKRENSEFNLGFYFDSNYHGKGYATEGCEAILQYAFSELKAEKVTSGTAAANRPARNLLTRLGMRKIGEEITSFRKTPEGNPIEFVGLRFSMSKNEWCKPNT